MCVVSIPSMVLEVSTYRTIFLDIHWDFSWILISIVVLWLDSKVLFEISHCKLFPLRFFFWQHDSGQVCPQEYPQLVY